MAGTPTAKNGTTSTSSTSTSTSTSTKKKNMIPVIFILDPAARAVLTTYAREVIGAIQALHPAAQLLVSAVFPTSHAIPTQPFLPASTFLSTLPSYLRRPSLPSSSLWRSSSGMVRAIQAGRKVIEGMAGEEGLNKQLPKYVVIISATDLDDAEQQEVWLEDNGQVVEDWESMAKTFTDGYHMTTLASLITVGFMPKLEAFWTQASRKFPPTLVYMSNAPVANNSFTFPLLAPSHHCFLVGFYNNRNPTPSQSAATAATAAAAAASNQNAKRVAPPETNSTATTTNKKQKVAPAVATTSAPTNPSVVGAVMPTTSSAQGVADYLSTQTQNGLAAKQAQAQALVTAKQALLTHQAQMQAAQQQNRPGLTQTNSASSVPQLPTVPQNLTTENLHAYLNDMKGAMARSGQSSGNIPDLSAALASYAAANPALSTTSPKLGGQTLSSNSFNPSPRQQARPGLPSSNSFNANQNQNQGQSRNPIPNLRNPGQQSPDNLPPVPDDFRQKLDQHMMGIREKLARKEISQEEATLQVKKLQELANAQRLHQAQRIAALQNRAMQGQQQALQNQQQQQQQQQQMQPSRQDSEPPKAPVWRGPISWSFVSGLHQENKQNFTIYCAAIPMQQTAVMELSNVQFPQAFSITSMAPIRSQQLQDLHNRFSLPAVIFDPLKNETLPSKVRESQLASSNLGSNEQLYGMLLQSLEQRNMCGIVKFGPGPKNGLVLMPMPGKVGRIVGIAFLRTELPDEWLQTPVQPQLTFAQQQQQQLLQQQQAHQRLQQQQQQQQQQQAAQLQQQQQQQFAAPQQAHMSMEDLERVLGKEKLAQIMAGNN